MNDDSRLMDLMERYLGGELSREEERDLVERLGRSPEALDRLRELLAMDEHLRQAVDPERGFEAFWRGLRERIRAADQGPSFRVRVLKNIRYRHSRRVALRGRRSPALAVGLALVACLAVALVGWLLAQGKGKAASEPVVREITPVEVREPTLPPPRKPVPPVIEEKPLPPVEPPAPPTPERPAPPEPRLVPPPPERPAPAPAAETAIAVARVERAAGEVFAEDASGRTRLEEGKNILEGQSLVTGGVGSFVVLRFPDATRLEAGARCMVRPERGKRVHLERGTVTAEVTRQPAGQAMTFHTPHAEVAVLGTRFTLGVTDDATRLEVAEGKVRFKRKLDGKTVEVMAGHYAVAAAGVELAAKLLPIDEILLLPRDGKIAGGDWRLVEDPPASTGKALEAPRVLDSKEGRARMTQPSASCVEFAFQAEADKEYHVWVRGCALAKERPYAHDAVGLAVVRGRWNAEGWDRIDAGFFTGYARGPGYWWIGGDWEVATRREARLLTVRFERPGRQVMRMYAVESPLRVDAIWLSTTQTRRPEPGQHGPPAAPR